MNRNKKKKEEEEELTLARSADLPGVLEGFNDDGNTVLFEFSDGAGSTITSKRPKTAKKQTRREIGEESTRKAVESVSRAIQDPNTTQSNIPMKDIDQAVKDTSAKQKRQVVAQAQGKTEQEVMREEKAASKDKGKKKGFKLSDSFKEALVALAPSALGTIAGGLVGGAAGAVEGFEKGNALGKQLLDIDFKKEDLASKQAQRELSLKQLQQKADVSKQQKLQLDLQDSRTGETLKTDNNGNILNSKNEIVPSEFVSNLRVDREVRLDDQGFARIKNTQEKTDIARESLDERKKENVDKDRLKLVDTFDKDKGVVQAREALARSQSIRDAVSIDSVFAPGVAVIALNRLAANTGPLSDIDLEIFGGSQAVQDRISRFIKKSTSGTLTKTDQQDILQIVDVLEKTQRDRIDRVRNRSIQRVSDASSDVSREEAQKILRDPKEVKKRLEDRIFTR